ncbi:XXYS1_4_G0019450.mRNA.1.CDS.1 [Saccharomyces cerevisiae]|nr:XXYS1_4_G0019450.mRNA.1.CDS.1 [Saccharomyces cerevisiae]
MSSDKSIEKNTDTIASEVHEGDNHSNNLVSIEEGIKSTPSDQYEEIAIIPTEPLHSDEELNDKQQSLGHEENEAPTNVSREEPIGISGDEDTQITEQNVNEQRQETREPSSEIDLNEPLNVEKDVTTDVQAPNGLNIGKEYDAVKENEKVYADTKDVVSSPENREVTGKNSGGEKLSSSKFLDDESGTTTAANANDISISSEVTPERSSENDNNQIHITNEVAAGINLNETNEQNIPTQVINEKGDSSSENEVSAIPTISSPPLPPRQNVATSTSPKLPPRGKQREQPPKTKNAVPPPLEEEMKSEKFRKNFEETKRNSYHHVPLTGSKTAQLESTAEINLIASRYRKTSHHLNKEGEETRESLQEGQSFLKSTFTSFLENLSEYNEVENVNVEDREMFKIDWSFWTQVVNDYATVASLHEATIRRDLRRTKFVAEDKMESLYKVIKVYSVYDPDVGYTQGMGFIAAPLLINCENEAESFGLLVGLMKNYGLRELFLPGMPGLMLMLYQFDRLLEEHSPSLYNRLIREGISSTMYATQWFLTFFAYKFPLEFVLRIFDIVFVEGIEVLLKFAVNLMLKNEETLVK